MSTLPTIAEHAADASLASSASAAAPRRSPSASSGSRASAVSPAWGSSSGGSTASSPAPAVPEKRKREAFEYRADSSDEEDDTAPAAAARNVQRRTSLTQAPRRNDTSRSTSPSLSSARGAAASSASAAAAPSVAASAPAPFSAHDPSLFGCRSVSCYRRMNTIDEGSYGVVHRAEERATKEQVALKKIKLDAQQMAAGFPITALREINILLALRHPNIVGLREIVTAKGSGPNAEHSIYCVLEYAEHDLKALMKRMGACEEDRDPAADAAPSSAAVPPAFPPFRVPEIKNLLRQLLSGVAYMHRNWVLHRDLKTSNLLYTNSGKLLICDFGLARRYGDPLGSYTPLVVTLWYRSPELLWGTKTYSAAVDMWAVGCIFAELLLNRPLMTGHSEMEQISKMLKLLGTPSLDSWPEFSQLEHAKNYSFTKVLPSRLRELFPVHSYTSSNALSDSGFNLLSQMLCYNPAKRITASEALAHPYFSEQPLPQSQALMPTYPASNTVMATDHHGPNSGDLRRKREIEAQGFYL